MRSISRGQTDLPKNEPLNLYVKGSPSRQKLDETLNKYYNGTPSIVPIVIGDNEYESQQPMKQFMPFEHEKSLCHYYYATPKLIESAIDTALKAKASWERESLENRCSIFLKAADLISTKYREELLATTMLGQAKTIHEAEIDAVAELADFLRFNVAFAKLHATYDPIDSNEATNVMNLRACEGFWAAITPFNFTAIAGNLPTAAAIMGNTVLWKPTDTAMLSNYTVFKILQEAGLPSGVINFVPADGPQFGKMVTSSPHLAGINFTGSLRTFLTLHSMVAAQMSPEGNIYRTFPRLIGECGGKNFHFVHPSADVDVVAEATVRSAFEYGGQKCSACSRMYVPQTLWPELKRKLLHLHGRLRIGSPMQSNAFYSAVIDVKAFERLREAIVDGKQRLELVAGGDYDDSIGYFVQPTIFLASDPHDRLMSEELFGPVLTVYCYPDDQLAKTMEYVNTTSPYALTGSIFAKDDDFINYFSDELRYTTGNFYVNVQSTGSVVGQQPFGGARLSGTNDKAGGPHYMLKFTSPQVIKTQTKSPALSWWKPHMYE